MRKKKMVKIYAVLFAAVLFPLVSCVTTPEGKVVSPRRVMEEVSWSDEELARDFAIRNLNRTREISTHIIRLNGQETPHAHDQHDLTVFVLSGFAAMHFEKRVTALGPGDVIEIPRGNYHWAESLQGQPCQVYAVFSPPYDGKDKREILPEKKKIPSQVFPFA